MTLHIGSNNIVDIRKGNQKIAKVYHGSDLVWGYVPGKVLFEKSVAGTYTLYVKCRCKLYIQAVGGGGGGSHHLAATTADNWWYQNSGGGSGGYIHGTVEVTAGTYTIVVGGMGTQVANGQASGGGNTTVFGQTAGGGGGGSSGAGTGGAGGRNSTTLASVNGNGGEYSATGYSDPDRAGGASVYGGYGAGRTSHNYGGSDGYVKITAI